MLFLLLSFFNIGLSTGQDVYYNDDKMNLHDKEVMRELSMDLLRDSILKMRQIVEIRREHEDKVAYSVGMIMGRIREKYRYMLEAYREIIVSYNQWFSFLPPGVSFYRVFHFIIALEFIHTHELEIDKLVDVLIEEASNDIEQNVDNAGEELLKKQQKPSNATDTTIGPTPPPRPSPTPTTLPPVDKDKRPQRSFEEAEKSLMRQRYLMKKLGQPINMTTMKKRFLRHWPVEESWRLDKYNYNY